MTDVTSVPTVQLTRRFSAPRDRVYELMTTPRYMERWFSPSADIGVKVIRHDFHEGGAYRLAYTQPDGSLHMVIGEFLTIRPGRQVAFTWTWEDPDPHAGVNTLVTWDFEETGDQCQLTVSHERLPDAAARERHQDGWHGTLERLWALEQSTEA